MTSGGTTMTTHVLLLGPVDLRQGESSCPLGAPRQRSLLALLALSQGRLVPVSAIIDGVWGDDPPGSAVNAVQVYVAGLRKALAGAGLADTLLTQAPGYRLALPPGTLDTERHLAWTTQAREHAGAGRPEAAAAAYQQAMSLWRGEAITDIDAPFAEHARAHWHEIHEQTRADWLAQLLAAGGHEQAVPALEQAVLAEPYREPLWLMLATALYRCGRQQDALGALRRQRRVLRTELGVDPGPPSLALERQILDHDARIASQQQRAGWGVGLRIGGETDTTHVVRTETTTTGVSTLVAGLPRLVLPDGRRVPLVAEQTVLGRQADCTVVLAHRDVSRRHAQVSATNTGHEVCDLDSTNGTAVNGHPVTGPSRLAHGDRIELGPVTVRYEIG